MTDIRVRRIPPDGFGAMLRGARERAGLGVRETARQLRLSPGYMVGLEAGTRCPSRTVAQRLAGGLALDAAERVQLNAGAVDDAGADHPWRVMGTAKRRPPMGAGRAAQLTGPPSALGEQPGRTVPALLLLAGGAGLSGLLAGGLGWHESRCRNASRVVLWPCHVPDCHGLRVLTHGRHRAVPTHTRSQSRAAG